MAEYVCDMTDDYPDVPYGADEYSGTLERRERIVRCRDCKHAAELGHLCLMFAFNLGNGTIIPPDVEPDGFCAWGRERED